MIPTIVCDFDGTLTEQDVGDAVCERFAEPGWRMHGVGWREGTLTLPEAQRRMWASVRAPLDALEAHATSIATLRPGALALFDAARAGRIELVIASGGFGFYIRAILGRHLNYVKAVYANELNADRSGATLELAPAELARGPYAICKGLVVERHAATAFCGDGSSDGGAIGADCTLYAVADSLFERACNEARRACVRFTDFRQLPFVERTV
ncbi:MAG: HAD-IB family phosphatase [Myxococcota bacterium]